MLCSSFAAILAKHRYPVIYSPCLCPHELPLRLLRYGSGGCYEIAATDLSR